jgi:CRISPR-associated protein Csb2
MVSLSFRFPGHRYHATRWDRHVNEAEVAWPPDPWRLCRALIATWHRKPVPGSSPDELEALLARLAASSARYRLPRTASGHTRHYMPYLEGTKEGRTLVFDAFLHVERGGELVVGWPDARLEPELGRLLEALVGRITYLGRAESWVEATVRQEPPEEWNCVPSDEAGEGGGGEPRISFAAAVPRTPEDYASFREGARQAAASAPARRRREMDATLPARWLDALSVETAELQKAAWNQPPAARLIEYVRSDAGTAGRAVATQRRTSRSITTTARYAIYGKPLPRVEDSVKAGEWLRSAVTSRAKKVLGGEDRIPAILCGHGLAEGNRHGHAFYLPEDTDGDGHVDHFVIHAPDGFDADARRVLPAVRRLYGRDRDLQVVLEHIGAAEELPASRLVSRVGAGTWISETPYLHPWFVKKDFSVEDQIRRECELRGYPAIISLERQREVRVGGRERRPIHFRRFLSKAGLQQPDRSGSFWKITFEQDLHGPLALGFGCHFGLGLFVPLASGGPPG